mgnify:FL=1
MEDTKKNEMWGKVMAPLAGFLAIVLVAFLIILKLQIPDSGEVKKAEKDQQGF